MLAVLEEGVEKIELLETRSVLEATELSKSSRRSDIVDIWFDIVDITPCNFSVIDACISDINECMSMPGGTIGIYCPGCQSEVSYCDCQGVSKGGGQSSAADRLP